RDHLHLHSFPTRRSSDLSNIPDSFQAFYTLQITDGSKTVKALWNSSYRQIYMCNAILEGISKSTMLEEETKNQLRGEALFSRARSEEHTSELQSRENLVC